MGDSPYQDKIKCPICHRIFWYSHFEDPVCPYCGQQKQIDRLREGIKQFLDGIDIEILQKLLGEKKDETH